MALGLMGEGTVNVRNDGEWSKENAKSALTKQVLNQLFLKRKRVCRSSMVHRKCVYGFLCRTTYERFDGCC